MINRLTEGFDFHAKALTLRAERQRVIAGNIANADTPGYRAVDFNFADALRAASGTADAAANASQPVRTHAGHLPAAGGGALAPTATLYRTPSQPALDSNTVDMDLERSQFAENAIRYEASLRFLNGNIRTLTQAISGNGQ